MRHVARCLGIVLVLCVVAGVAAAQEETLFGENVARGGFGGPVAKYSSVHDQGALIVGGRGGWIFDHSLSLGGGAYGVVTGVDAGRDVLGYDGPVDVELGYGGLEIEYAFDPSSVAHITLYTLIGGGATNYVKDTGSSSGSREHVGEDDVIFVLEPAAGGELNVTKGLHLAAVVSYRLVREVDLEGLTGGDLSGIGCMLTLKFGHF